MKNQEPTNQKEGSKMNTYKVTVFGRKINTTEKRGRTEETFKAQGLKKLHSKMLKVWEGETLSLIKWELVEGVC